jgi:ADP-heptose:LPS heptosyltransferase
MINLYFKFMLKNVIEVPPSLDMINDAKTTLFSIFTRYGDTIIDLVIIKEFIELYPNKQYLLICPKQMKPYVNEILPSIECFAFNKRNIFELYRAIKLLKSRSFDVGFNPWSNGLDSSFFLSFCKNFLFYKDFDRPQVINHYQVVRRYLKLPEKNWRINKLNLKKDYSKILICPQSTDNRRNITNEELDKLILEYIGIYSYPQITIASMDKTYFRDGCKSFYLEKSFNSSKLFLSIIKNSSLVVCSDSGPLHIALALKKDLIVIMKSTKPEDVINYNSTLLIRDKNLLND